MKNFKSMKTFLFQILVIIVFSNSIEINAQNKLISHDAFTNQSEKQLLKSKDRAFQATITNNYNLNYHRFFWFIDPAKRYISGSVTSYFTATTDLITSIQFQLTDSLSADSVFYKGNKTALSHTGNILTISLNPAVTIGKLDSVTVFYHGVPGLTGFGSFVSDLHNGAPCMWTLSEPYGASDWWPSKNDLTDKIDSTDIYVVMPKGNHAASNGILVSETPWGNTSTLAHWKHRYPIASYLVCVAVTNYARYSDYYKTGKDSIEVLNYVYPEDSVELRPKTLDVLKSMALFEQLFAPYPFRKEKFGHAQCNLDGAMEHQTMTFLGKNSFNHYIFTHELSHQWFGDMITCGSWEDIWLNEGFATYCTALSYENLYNKSTFINFMNELSNDVITNPQGSVFCNDTTSSSSIFHNSLRYSKGAYLLHMLRWILGDHDFFQGLRNYLNDPALKYGFAHTADLKRHLETQSGKDLTRFFADWFYGTGVPAYSIQVNQQQDMNTTVTVNQTQYNSNVPFFNMVLPIKLKGILKDTTILITHTYSGQLVEFNPHFKIDSIFFDPDHKILSYHSEVSLNQVTLIQQLSEPNIVISPNPANGTLFIHHPSGQINFIRILNPEGKSELAITAKQDDTLLALTIQHLHPGIYLLQVGTSDWFETKKFIVIK